MKVTRVSTNCSAKKDMPLCRSFLTVLAVFLGRVSICQLTKDAASGMVFFCNVPSTTRLLHTKQNSYIISTMSIMLLNLTKVYFFEKFIVGFLLRNQYERGWHIIGGHIFFQTLVTGVEVGLFEVLAKKVKLTREQIVEKLGLASKPVLVMLMGLLSIRVMVKKGNYYSLNYISKRFFVSISPYNILATLQWQKYINYKAMFYMTEAFNKNSNIGLQEFSGNEPTLYERLKHDGRLNQIFQDVMEDFSKQATVRFFNQLDTFSSSYVVDVGGGNGTVLMSLAAKNTKMKGVVMDIASVENISRNNVKNKGYSDRIGFHPGSCCVDPFPTGVDMILFSHFFTIWPEEDNKKLLRKTFESLPSGGKVVLFNMMQRDSEDGLLRAAMGSPYFLTIATGEGMLYCWKDYTDWLKEAGFTKSTQDYFTHRS